MVPVFAAPVAVFGLGVAAVPLEVWELAAGAGLVAVEVCASAFAEKIIPVATISAIGVSRFLIFIFLHCWRGSANAQS